jgi:phospholipid/cholesterol/gamma-HCH transport system substrate-binding protein
MSENRTEVLVGGAVLALAVGFLVYVLQAAGVSRAPAGYELRAAFRSVEGVKVGTDVRMAGVRIGSVTQLSLNPETFFAEARFAIRDGIALPTDSAVLVASEGLLGGYFVEILPGGALETLGPGDEIEDTQGAVSLTTLLLKFVGGMGSGDEGASE